VRLHCCTVFASLLFWFYFFFKTVSVLHVICFHYFASPVLVETLSGCVIGVIILINVIIVINVVTVDKAINIINVINVINAIT